MKRVRMVALMIAGFAVSACSSLDVASRNAPFEASGAKSATTAAASAMNVVSYQVRVPETLKVSEANSYFPSSDIVWRGDALGDRHQQVKAMFETSLERGVFAVPTGVPVVLDIEVTRFHGVTEKTRYSIGGSHGIFFTMNFLHPETRKPVAPSRVVDATFKALSGSEAIVAESKGNTQKVRVTNRLTGVIQHELGLTKDVARAAAPAQSAPETVSRNAIPAQPGQIVGTLY